MKVELSGGELDGDRWDIMHDLLYLQFAKEDPDQIASTQYPAAPSKIVFDVIKYKRTDRINDGWRIYEYEP